MTYKPVAETLPVGPRRDAVAKVERDIELLEGSINMGLELRYSDPMWFEQSMDKLRALRQEHASLLVCHIDQIPGAVEWFQEQDRKRRMSQEGSEPNG